MVASRLLQYEMFNRIHARRLGPEACDAARALLTRIDLVDLRPEVLAPMLEPFPVRVRTLDALHLATMIFLRGNGGPLTLATYDHRLAAAAQACAIDLQQV